MNLRDIALGTVVYPLATVREDETVTRDIQSRLASWGYQPGPADGDWASRTEDAYLAFARDFSYSTQSIAPRTAAHLASLAWRSLKAIANQSNTFTLFSLRDNPLIAREIQDRLKALGYNPGPIDGLWGATTQAAFTAFAQKHRLPSDRLSPEATKRLLGMAEGAGAGAGTGSGTSSTGSTSPTPGTGTSPTPGTGTAPSTPPSTPLPTLRDVALGTISYPLSSVKSNATLVRDMQFRLASWDYPPGPIDGAWGNATESAYGRFANDFGYPPQTLMPAAAAQLNSLAFRKLSDVANQSSTFTLFSINRNPLIAKEVQQRLKGLGFYTGAIDADWGKGTQTAYEKFAQANQLPLDRMSPESAKALLNEKAPEQPVGGTDADLPPADAPLPQTLNQLRQQGQYRWPLARLAQSPSLIKELQQALTAMGHAPGDIDGKWGGRTKTAYESFAQVYGVEADRLSPRVAKLLMEPEVPSITALAKPPQLNSSDYIQVAQSIGTNPATIRAVVEVEAAGSGFFSDGRPKILFEAHWFSAFTDGRYDYSHPSISSPVWNRSLYIGGVGEWDRLYRALRLDRAAALMSASWGLGQVMGFNHNKAGHSTVEEFVKAMHQSEGKQLVAMFEFIKSENLGPSLVARDWANFAFSYNGEGYRVNQYDLRLAEAYDYWRNASNVA
jgi:peptidoglycan hydrolase-like protein with peptidoglycan-binding domain